MNEWNLLRRLHVHYRHRARYVCIYVHARSVAHVYLYPSTIGCAHISTRKQIQYVYNVTPSSRVRSDARDEAICLSRVPCIYERNATMKATNIRDLFILYSTF